ncbi:hypothetical protein BaRGS_00011567 [Batillaria attramentaria]|uniref:Uncharacterized protein n=1 Tax=Batillaria attramentaria TaxID=370345 RepID=A0ABD0LCY4_9CAEN
MSKPVHALGMRQRGNPASTHIRHCSAHVLICGLSEECYPDFPNTDAGSAAPALRRLNNFRPQLSQSLGLHIHTETPRTSDHSGEFYSCSFSCQ